MKKRCGFSPVRRFPNCGEIGAAFRACPIVAAMMPWRFPQPCDASHVFFLTPSEIGQETMSDMRNFGSSNEPMTMSEKIPETNLGTPAQFHDTVGLSNFHQPVEEETNSNTARMVGAAVVVVMLCGAGAYAYMSSSATPKSPVSTSSLSASNAPQSVAANTPPAPAMQTAPATPPSTLANSPYGSAPVGKSSPAATPASAPEDTTIVKHHVRTARAVEKKDAVEDKQEAQTTNQLNTQESASVTPAAPANTANATTPSANDNVASSTPLPTPPDAPSSSVASNGQPATPAPQNLSPVPSETPIQPAPATPAPDTNTQQPNQAAPAQVQPQ
jgi:hypothetical protein